MEKNKKETLSVIIPTYKQERTILRDLKHVKMVLDQLGYEYEVIVVVDGILDRTYEEAKKLKAKDFYVYKYKENQGKGYAIRYGMLKAKGDIIGFIDAGMDLDPNGISMLLSHMEWYDADIIVGSKLHPVSQVEYPFFRRILSWGYRTINRVLFGLKIRDTQVGMKFYKRKVVEEVFPKLLVKRFAFDVETLAVANALGFTRIYDAPIKLKFNNASTIDTIAYWKVVWNMLWDTAAVFYRIHILHYYQKQVRNVKR